MWVCPTCSHNNIDTDGSCLICGGARPVERAEDSVCTLTKNRAKDIRGGEVFIPAEYNVIGEYAFKGRTDITEVYIHSGVKKIMRGAFEGCTMLSRVQSDSRLNSVGARAFAGCTYLCPERRPTASRVASDAYEGCSETFVEPPARPAPPARERDTALRSPSRPIFTTGSGTRPSTSGSSGTRPSTSGSSGTRPSTSGRSGARPSTSGSSGFVPSTSGWSSTPSGSSGRATTAPTPTRKKGPFSWWTDRYTSSLPTVSRGTRHNVVSNWGAFLLIALVAFTVGLAVLMNYGRLMTSERWQYAFAIPLSLGITLFSYLFLLDDDYERTPQLHIAANALTLAVWLIWGGNAAELVLAMSVTLAVTGACCMLAEFNNGVDKHGFSHLELLLLDIAFVAYILIDERYRLDTNDWQLLVALLIALAYIIFLDRFAGDDYNELYVTAVVHAIIFVVMLILLFTFRTGLGMLLTVLPIFVGIASCGVAGKCFDEYEENVAWVHISLAALNTAIAVFVNLYYA